MRLHRFYRPETIGLQKNITIDSVELVHQIRNVFRLKTGDDIKLFDGSGNDYLCRIENADKDFVKLLVIDSEKSRFMSDRDITLFVAIVKKDTFEWIVEKATELGVTRIIPIMAERSEKKSLNEDRLKKIAVEASEQSGRGSVPEIAPIISLKEFLENNTEETDMVAFHTDGEVIDSSDFKDDDLTIFIGPEGGWSPDEIALFHSNGIPVISLGNQVLRAETAVISALSVVMLGK